MVLGDIRDVCMDFEPCSKVYNLVSIRPKSMKLGQMINLNVIFNMVGSVYRLVTIRNSPQFPVEFRNGLFGHLVWRCLIVFGKIWRPSNIRTKTQNISLFSCLMGDVLFVWTAAYQTCLMRACVPRLLSGLYELFDLSLIKHVLNVWPLTSTLACLVTKQCLMVFGRETFPVCPELRHCQAELYSNISKVFYWIQLVPHITHTYDYVLPFFRVN